MLSYLKKQAGKYKLSKAINKFDSVKKTRIEVTELVNEAVEFEVPENAQYNPRIPDLIHGKVES